MNADDLALLLTVGEGDAPAAVQDPRLHGLTGLAAAMGSPPPGRDAPVREVMARLGDNWSALIIKVLATGSYRYATLKRVIGALSSEGEITQRMLTLRLRALERDGFVLRHVRRAIVPPRVDYTLSPLGQDLGAQLDGLLAWIEAQTPQILAARAHFREED